MERSHGKARPSLPRASDLRVVESAETPSDGRDAGGRFAPGNRVSIGNRWKASIKRLLGRSASPEQADDVSRQAWRLYLALMRELPSTGANVRMLAAMQARHAALAAHFTDRAGELGLETTEGKAALDRASKDGQRAERLAVTALDVATRFAEVHRFNGSRDPHKAVVDAFGEPAPTRPAERPATTADAEVVSSENPYSARQP
jgi:hypothetical protein